MLVYPNYLTLSLLSDKLSTITKRSKMARNKSESHQIVLKAAKQEFLEKGFEGASIRSIGKRAGMTSAALYRHAKDKEDLFSQLVEPFVNEFMRRCFLHEKQSYDTINNNNGLPDFNDNEIVIIMDMSERFSDEMKLIFCKSKGTKYETFLHEFIELQQTEMEKVLAYLETKGHKVKKISAKELHVFLSSYITAIVEPIVHDYTKEETKECLLKMQDFFTPGWMNIMGY